MFQRRKAKCLNFANLLEVFHFDQNEFIGYNAQNV